MFFTIFTTIALVLAFFYAGILLWYVYGWVKTPEFKLLQNFEPQTTISIIVPARNEAANIVACLKGLLSQSYPKHLFEIVLIDDQSEDETVNLATAFLTANKQLQHPDNPDGRVQIIKIPADLAKPSGNQSSGGKKNALTLGIAAAKYHLIVTTDADCQHPPTWLQYIAGFYQQYQPQMIAAPVVFKPQKGLFMAFQTLDFIGLMLTTAASLKFNIGNMCNGANLAYPRHLFNAVGGFEGQHHLASGDDMLLMEKIRQQQPKAKLLFLKAKQATVQTNPTPNLKQFFWQRVRWASKTTAYRNLRIQVILTLVWLFNFSIVAGMFALLTVNRHVWMPVLALQFALKLLADTVFLYTGAAYFNRKKLLWQFLPAQIMHIFYIVVVGVAANFKSLPFVWKGRKIR